MLRSTAANSHSPICCSLSLLTTLSQRCHQTTPVCEPRTPSSSPTVTVLFPQRPPHTHTYTHTQLYRSASQHLSHAPVDCLIVAMVAIMHGQYRCEGRRDVAGRIFPLRRARMTPNLALLQVSSRVFSANRALDVGIPLPSQLA